MMSHLSALTKNNMEFCVKAAHRQIYMSSWFGFTALWLRWEDTFALAEHCVVVVVVEVWGGPRSLPGRLWKVSDCTSESRTFYFC